MLLSNPEITDVAVISYPDEEAGQVPMSFVVRKPGSNLCEEDVNFFVAKQVNATFPILFANCTFSFGFCSLDDSLCREAFM